MKEKNDVNKKRLVRSISLKCGMDIATTSHFMDAFIETFREAMESGQGICLQKIGSFVVKERPKRNGYNPVSRSQDVFEAKKKIKFNPSKTIKLE